MSELDFLEILKMFDIFFMVLENPSISKEMNIENVTKTFQCGQFIETTIAKAYEIDKQNVLENHLHNHWLKEGRSKFYKCSELKNACDKLLELYLKDTIISTDIVDEFLKLYVQYCGSDRLNNFFKHTLINGVCINIIIESLKELGVSDSDMQDEALIMSWELLIDNGNHYEVSACIQKMYDNGFLSKLVQFSVNLNDTSKVKKIIIQLLSAKLVENDVDVCLTLINLKKKLICKLMESNSELYTNFLDAIFYFGRHMKQNQNHWTSENKLEYEHLLNVVQILVNGPKEISEIICNRMQLVKAHPNGTIWHKIEKDIG
ncbi:ubiquitin-fold modifier 1 isoform X2 [Calliopsis andreniformis]